MKKPGNKGKEIGLTSSPYTKEQWRVINAQQRLRRELAAKQQQELIAAMPLAQRELYERAKADGHSRKILSKEEERAKSTAQTLRQRAAKKLGVPGCTLPLEDYYSKSARAAGLVPSTHTPCPLKPSTPPPPSPPPPDQTPASISPSSESESDPEPAPEFTYKMISDMRAVLGDLDVKKRLRELAQSDDKMFVFMVKEMMAYERTLKEKDTSEGGQGFFVVIRGLEDEKRVAEKIGNIVTTDRVSIMMTPREAGIFVEEEEGV